MNQTIQHTSHTMMGESETWYMLRVHPLMYTRERKKALVFSERDANAILSVLHKDETLKRCACCKAPKAKSTLEPIKASVTFKLTWPEPKKVKKSVQTLAFD